MSIIHRFPPSVNRSCASKADEVSLSLQVRRAMFPAVAQFSVSMTSLVVELSIAAVTFKRAASPPVSFPLFCRFDRDRVTPHSILAAK